MRDEKIFRFNPFTIKNWTDEQVKTQYELLESTLRQGDTPFELATDIDIFANMGYLIGEMVARYSEDVSIKDNTVKINYANETYKERDYYMKTHSDKAPAMSYFENRARAKLMDEYSELARAESSLQRFKFAYASIESKQNALKKRLEAIKYDIK
jgi:hypothetical protein